MVAKRWLIICVILFGAVFCKSDEEDLTSLLFLAILASPTDNWTSVQSGTTNDLYEVIYANNRFYAVGRFGTLLASADGTNWSKIALTNTTRDLRDIVYTGGTFVVVGDDRYYATSTNGTTWSEFLITGGTGFEDFYSVATDAAGTFVFVGVSGSNNYLAVTTDLAGGAFNFGAGGGTALVGVAYGGGIFGAGGTSGQGSRCTATCGTLGNWTNFQVASNSRNIKEVVYAGGKFILGTAESGVYTTTDFTSFTRATVPAGSSLSGLGINSVIHDGNRYLALGDINLSPSFFLSTDGTSWSGRTGPPTWCNGIATNGSVVVAVGNGGVLYKHASYQ